MLALDDPLWHNLETGGQPEQFLPLLKMLEADPASAQTVHDECLEGQFFSHQGVPYATAIAVVPHFIHAASRLAPPQRHHLLAFAGVLAGEISCSRKKSNEGLIRLAAPTKVWESFDRSLPEGARLTAEHLLLPQTEADFMDWLATLAGFSGHPRVMFAVHQAGSSVFCPACGFEFEPLLQWDDPYGC
jgi:hypothetical protein